MKRILLNMTGITATALFCIFVLGHDTKSVFTELVWLVGILAFFMVGISLYMGWALTRAMNPKPKKEPDDGLSDNAVGDQTRLP